MTLLKDLVKKFAAIVEKHPDACLPIIEVGEECHDITGEFRIVVQEPTEEGEQSSVVIFLDHTGKKLR